MVWISYSSLISLSRPIWPEMVVLACCNFSVSCLLMKLFPYWRSDLFIIFKIWVQCSSFQVRHFLQFGFESLCGFTRLCTWCRCICLWFQISSLLYLLFVFSRLGYMSLQFGYFFNLFRVVSFFLYPFCFKKYNVKRV